MSLRSRVDAVRRRPRVRATEEVVRAMVDEVRDDRVNGLAAEIAFFGVLSLFPALLATAALLGSLEVVAGATAADRVQEEIVGFFQRVLTDDAGGTVDAVEQLFAEPSPGLLTIGLLAAFWSLSRGFAAVIRALDEAYDLDEGRGWVSQRLTAIALSFGTIVTGAVLLVLLVMGPLLGEGRDVAESIGLGSAFATFWDWLRPPLAFVALVLWAATLFHIAPDHRTPWRSDLPGALLSAVAWLAVSVGFRLYLQVAADGNQVFGVLGGAVIVLLWFYLLAVGLLLGGELNAILATRRVPPHPPR